MSETATLDLTAEREKRSAAASSVFAAVFLAGLKLVVGLLTGSLGILAEAAHSGLDLVAAIVTYIAVRVADRPADATHAYGHGKVENFSALVETGLLFVTCAWIIYEALRRLFFHEVEVDPNLWGFLVMAVSIGVDLGRSRILYRAARKHHSQALEADALHFSTDIWSSSVVIVGLALVWFGKNVFTGQSAWFARADAVAALGVAMIVLFVSYRLGKRTIDVLLDRTPEDLVGRFRGAAAGVDGVLNVTQVRVRRSGPRVFVDMNVEVDRNLAFERAHAIADDVAAEVQAIAPGADVVVHTDPREDERETLARRIRSVANRNQMAVHNIFLHDENGRVAVDLHLEVDDHLSLRQAHDLASHVEKDLLADMVEIARVTTHIESRGTSVGNGVDVSSTERNLVENIKRRVDRLAGPGRCHDVVVRRYGGVYSVALHCFFPKDLPIIKVHEASTAIETELRQAFPVLEHVLVHTEPDTR
ncbi:MAG: cation-efflux pump [Candidatus Aminicenantes bacterium]|nr:cation-efflux pump [Candidatus Aminicenantes bacterium]